MLRLRRFFLPAQIVHKHKDRQAQFKELSASYWMVAVVYMYSSVTVYRLISIRKFSSLGVFSPARTVQKHTY